MTDILDKIDISPLVIIVIYILGIITTELWNLVKSRRVKAAENISNNILKELDDQLQHFYLPICERLKITKEVFGLTKKVGYPFKNKNLGIKSKDPLALKRIMLNKLLIPFNVEIENVILNNLHLRHPDDQTNYSKIVQHYRFWNALEESIADKYIDDYEATDYLKFPVSEAESCQKMCNNLLQKRENIRSKLLTYKGINKSVLLTKTSKK